MAPTGSCGAWSGDLEQSRTVSLPWRHLPAGLAQVSRPVDRKTYLQVIRGHTTFFPCAWQVLDSL